MVNTDHTRNWQLSGERGSELMSVPGRKFDFQVSGPQQWLPSRIATAQGVAVQLPSLHVQVEADQAVGPVAIHAHGLMEQTQSALVIGAAKEDDQRLRWRDNPPTQDSVFTICCHLGVYHFLSLTHSSLNPSSTCDSRLSLRRRGWRAERRFFLLRIRCDSRRTGGVHLCRGCSEFY
jgi:hypothetical protein